MKQGVTYTEADDTHYNHSDEVQPGHFEPLAKRRLCRHVHNQRTFAAVASGTMMSGRVGGSCICSVVALEAGEETHFDMLNSLDVSRRQQE